MKRKQTGLSLGSVLIIGVFLAFFLVMGLRTAPAIAEYIAIQRVVVQLAAEGDNDTPPAEIRRSFERRAIVDNIESVTAADLEISKQNGRTVVEVEYSRVVPIIGNASLLLDFKPSSTRN